MRKVTNFIVKGRYFFLLLFIFLAGICLFLSTKVNINEDIMQYLPSNSETKIGKDIMDKEFSKQDTSVLNVMFKGLSDSEKEDTLKKLQSIDGVSSVDYENTEEFNNGKYTLYVLNVNDYDNSKTSTNVYNYVKDNFKVVGMSGSIYDANKPILEWWIVAIAILCAMVILIILSNSYLEPWLYLISIGIAIFINKGTNIMFDSVSSITNSIVAILQLALSMDYSIMLSNRYKQEKEKNNNKVNAMKEALYQSFKAISSSSVTTIVGLIALVFMSFTIGKDLGLVLAKGVLLSLASIFFCLPALLLIFDNLISKTKKKSPKFNLSKLGNIIYKTRYIHAIMIVVLFIGAYFLKGNIEVLYTGSEQDKVGKIFPATNQLAIVYNNKYEDIITDYCKELEKDKKIDQVLCYSNTINEKLAYDELNKQFKDLGQDVTIEDYLLKIIYYHYYNQEENNKMTLNEFVSFIKSDIYTNDSFSDKVDQKTRNNLELLENFTSLSLMNKERTKQEIANILGMDITDVENIFIYYNSKNNDTKMTIKDFINFILNDIANDSKYQANIDASTINSLKILQNFTDVDKINKEMSSSELAKIFGLDEELIKELLLLYRTSIESDTKLTLNEFANYALSLISDSKYSNMFGDTSTVLDKLQILSSLSDEEFITIPRDQDNMLEQLNNMKMGLDKDSLLLLYMFYTGYNTDTKLTLSSYATYALILYNNGYSNYFPTGFKEKMELLLEVPDKTTYSVSDIVEKQYGDITLTSAVFGSYDFFSGKLKDISIQDLINFIYLNKDNPLLQDKIKDMDNQLELAYRIVNNTSTLYNYLEISNFLEFDKEVISKVYGVYDYNNQVTTLSPLRLVNFILDNRNNDLLKDNLSPSTIQELYLLKEVMGLAINDKECTSRELSSLLGIDNNTVNLLFGLYNYKHIDVNQGMSLYDYVNFIIKDVMNSKEYASNFDIEKKEKLNTVSLIMNSSKANTKYSITEAFNILSKLSNNLDKSLFELVYLYYGSSREYNDTWKMTILEFVDYLNNDIIMDKRFDDFIDSDRRTMIVDAKKTVDKSKKMIVSDKYSRVVLNTKYAFEDNDTYQFINKLENDIGNKEDIYVVGNSSMAFEMSKTFDNELNKITILTMIFIFIVVAITFKDLIIPFVLVLIIQTAVYITMSVITLAGGKVYFIALLIVQAILMGATIDYAIVYTSYYRESRLTIGIKDAVINAYNKSINTIISSSTILIIVTLIVANFASAITAQICETISQGTFASVILILLVLPGVLATYDKLICRKGYYKDKVIKVKRKGK